MINDRSKPLDWPPKDGYSVDSDDAAGVIDAVLAVAAELRTGNLIALQVAQSSGAFASMSSKSASLLEIRKRLGLE